MRTEKNFSLRLFCVHRAGSEKTFQNLSEPRLIRNDNEGFTWTVADLRCTCNRSAVAHRAKLDRAFVLGLFDLIVIQAQHGFQYLTGVLA